VTAAGGPLSARELGRFLEIQNLGLNLPFALGFLVLAAQGIPPLVPTLLLVVAFVAARNAGHSFNRWADRDLDARNPRTRSRALVTGRASPAFALGITAVSAAVLVLAAYLLNPLALILSPVALAIVLGYSLTKRRTAWTTVLLGLVEAITPAAVFIGLMGRLPVAVLLAVGALLLWGTAFETVHSLGDLETDRSLGLPSLPGYLGAPRSTRLVPGLHAAALGLLAAFGIATGLGGVYLGGLGAMAIITAWTDATLLRDSRRTATVFRAHFALSAVFFVTCVAAVALGG
jgi:4-hydroxybenzoate polyprenyltransferase